MATLEGHHPLIALRSRGRQPPSLLAVVLIAAATLGLAVVIAELGDSTGGSTGRVAAAPAAPPSVPAPAARREPRYLSPRGTEIPPSQADLPRGYTRRYEGSSLSVVPASPPSAADGSRYDGGPDEGTRGPSR